MQLKSTDVQVARSGGGGQPVFFKIELTGDTEFDWSLFCGSIRRNLHLPIDFRDGYYKTNFAAATDDWAALMEVAWSSLVGGGVGSYLPEW